MTVTERFSPITVRQVITYPVKSLPGIRRPQGVAITENGLEGDRLFTLAGAADMGDVAPRLTLREYPELARIRTAYTCDGVELQADDYEPLQLPGDIVEGPSMQVKSWGGNVTGVQVSTEASDWLSSVIGRKAHILAVPDSHRRELKTEEQHPDVPPFTGRGTDGYPIHVVSLASLRRFNEMRYSQFALDPVGIEAFRANIIVDGELLPPFAEDSWQSMQLQGEGLDPVDIIALGACGRCKSINVDPRTGISDGRMLQTLKNLRTERGQKELIFGLWAAPHVLSIGGIIKAGQSIIPVNSHSSSTL